MHEQLPLSGIRVVENASGVAAAYAGRLLAAMGADVIMVEPPEHSRLRREPPFLDSASKVSALFTYVAAGKFSLICDLETKNGRDDFTRLVADAHILIDDTPISQRLERGLDPEKIAKNHPQLVHLSVLPFGAEGLKAGWKGSELNLMQASGEGYLLPNGLSATLFPNRPPLKIAGHFAEMQGGIAAALSALAALWVEEGQYVDVSVQDANVAVGAFSVQRFGDGSLEHRVSRSFRYGGVIECRDGYVELLTLEDRQWQALVSLMGHPDWATDKAMDDPVKRGERGDDINSHIRNWARDKTVNALVAQAQELGVPMARYNSPQQVLDEKQAAARNIFTEIEIPGAGICKIQAAPFRFSDAPASFSDGPTLPGADQNILQQGWDILIRQPQRKTA